ncbi:MAG: VOC family protein [Gammaproteobacteria bacterium]
MLAPVAFHLAIPVNDIESTRVFYEQLLGCSVGREASHWIDFNFFGHQLSAHVKPEATQMASTNPVDGEAVPVRHFGLVLAWQDWHALVEKLDAQQVEYLIKPTLRFQGEAGEQATLFINDPSGNAIEFKSFRDTNRLFASD